MRSHSEEPVHHGSERKDHEIIVLSPGQGLKCHRENKEREQAESKDSRKQM